MNELKTIVANIPFLPEWAKVVALHLLGIYVVLQLFYLILKKLQTPELRNAISTWRKLSGEALRKAVNSLELPVERPWLEFIALVVNTVLFYVLALILFALFGVFFMLAATDENLTIIKRLLAFAVAASFYIGSRWHYVSAERQRIALVKRWKTLRRNNNS